MKAITPVIAIIILLLITVAVGGAAYTFLLGFYSPQTTHVLSLVDASCSRGVAKMTFINGGTSSINISGQLMQTEPYVPDSNTVLLLHFDGDMKDASGQGNDGSCTSCPESVSGIFGGAYKFDGVNNLVNVSSSGDIDSLGQPGISYSVELWFNSSVRADQSLTEKWETSASYAWALRGPLTSLAGGMTFNIYDGTNGIYVDASATAYDDEQWHHIAGIRDASAGKIRLYVDGKMIGETADTLGDVSNPGNFPVGARKLAGVKNFAGTIDEVRISRVARNFSQKQQGWNYWCPVAGNEAVCGNIVVEKVSGGGGFSPGFSRPLVGPQESFVFKDGNCRGTCTYRIVTPSGAFTAGASCG
jgi:flagellin-like protein